MSQYFNLSLDTTAPLGGSISVLAYYKDNATPITLSADGASFMKVWIDQTATTATVPTGLSWIPYATSWTPNFSVEGDNYIHAVFMDAVGNQGAIKHSDKTIFDKTAPVISNVVINDGADITAVTVVNIKVTAADTSGSGVGSVTFTGVKAETTSTFTWNDTERSQGYKVCTITLPDNAEGVDREVKTVVAQCTDRAGNVSQVMSDNIVLYTGGVDPVIVLKDSTDTNVLGEYTNSQDFSLNLQIIVGEISLVHAYKVYGDFNTDGSGSGTEEPEYTDWPTGQSKVVLARKFKSGDGTKTIRAKVKVEEEGTEVEKTLTVATVKYDATAPTVVLSSAQSVISDKTGHDSTVLTAAISDTYSSNEYKIVAYASAADATSGTAADPTNVDLYGTNPITTSWTPTLLENKLITAVTGEGAKYIVCYVKDVAGNWGKSNTVTVSIDLTAPTGSISVDQYYKESKGFTASATDTVAGMSKMKAWVDNSATNTTPPPGATEKTYKSTTVTDTDYFFWVTDLANGNAYVHILYTDLVGNSAVTHSGAFLYDTVAPVGCSVTAPARTNTQTITVTLAANDVTSGMGKMKLYGDIDGAGTPEAAAWENYATSKNITLSGTDGTKTINVLFQDNAGNVITTAVSTTTVLDTGTSAATINLLKSDRVTPLPSKVNVRSFTAKVAANEGDTDIAYYKIYGNVGDTAVSEADAPWREFVYVEGETYMIVPASGNLSITPGEGLKTIYAKIKDTAGNVSSAASATVTLDTTAPTVDVKDIDHNTISKQHTLRLDSTGTEITGHYNDKMTFTFSPDTPIVQYKVCVNVSGQAAATATAIPTAGGSINMSGVVSPESSASINCTIMGLDYENAIKAAYPSKTEWDGVYEVIVYVKDSADNWSAVHAI